MNISKVEKILNHQQHLYFNMNWDDDDYYQSGRNAGIAEFKKEIWDLPIQVELGEKFPFAGFVGIDGTTYKCKPCEHEKLVRDMVYNIPEHFKRYLNVPAIFYDRKPQGMLQEEYFLMKYLGFVKISSFANAPTKRILFRYENLTWKQSDVIYPQ